MDLNAQKEKFSEAYVRAVASVSGLSVVGKQDPDDDKVDLTLGRSGGRGTLRSPKLDLQLKCTADDKGDLDNVKFELDVETYNSHRQADYHLPRILVVVFVPEQPANWVNHSQDSLVLKRCGYWKSLKGEPAITNVRSITLSIPRWQVFSPEGLNAIMDRIQAGGEP